MKCRRPNCNNQAKSGRHHGHQGYCQKHYDICPTRGLVDSTEVRQRVELLRSRGYSWPRLAEATGISEDALLYLGRWSPDGKVEKLTHLKIMNVPVPERIIDKGNQSMPAVGTRRRIQSLMAFGWSAALLGKELGVSEQCVRNFLRKQTVCATTVVRIRDLFDRLQMTPGPSKRTAAHARRQGWVPPLAWDEDSIDDPNAVPDELRNRRTTQVEQYRELRYLGFHDDEIAMRLDVPRYWLNQIRQKAS